MANRYWVGGTGAWSSTSTANWSTATGLSFTASRTSTTLITVGSPALAVGMTVWGSTGTNLGTITSGSVNTWVMNTSGTVTSQSMSAATIGASVPTAADSVFFDANSNSSTTAFTVTMSVTPRLCNDFTASGLDGTMTLAGSAIGLTVSGNLTFQATNFTRTYTGTTTFNATTTGKTVTTNGVAFGSGVTFDGVGGGWTLGSAFSCGSSDLTVTNGTFNTSVSNYSVTAGRLFSDNANLRTINLNGSTVTVSGIEPVTFTTSTNLTFNVGTSTLNCSNAFPTFGGAGLTYYNVSFTSTTTQPIITGTNTFNNLSITGRTTIGVGAVSIYANQTINGTLTVSAGTASAYRIQISSDTLNTPRTLTCAAVSLTDTDFKDITIVGAAAPATGTRLGNGKGNSGITFGAAKTVYWGQTGSASWGATGSGSWSATSGGALDATMFPLAQDTCVFPAATYPASGSTTTINLAYNIGTIDMSLRTSNTMTLATGTTPLSIYGNWITGTGITLSGTGILTFTGRTTQQITSAGITFTQPITINSPSGSVTLQDALNIGTRDLLIPQGTFDTSSSGYAVTAASLQLNQTKPRGANLNASTITLSAQYPISIPSSLGGLTWNAGTSTINCTSTVVSWFPGSSQTYYNVAFTYTFLTASQLGVGTSDASIFNNLTITGRAIAGLGVLSVGANHTINGTFTVSAGTASAYRIAVVSNTFNTSRTLTCAAVSLTDVDFRDITIAGVASPASGTRIGDGKGNSGITFDAAKTVYYGQTGSANWGATGSGSWSATSGGALDATQFPLAQDTAVFPAATYPASGFITTINADYYIGTIDMSLRTSNTMQLATGSTNPVICGNWIGGTGIINASTGGSGVIFSGRTTQQITSAGSNFSRNLTINSPSGSVTLQDALASGASPTTTLTNGTLDLQSYTLSTGLFSSNNSNTRTIAFGTGNITCSGTGTVWTTNNITGLTTTGTQVVNVTSVGSTAITVTTGALSEANSISYNFTGGTYGLLFLSVAGHTARSVNFTGYSGGLSVLNTPIIYGNLTLSAGMTLTSYIGAVTFGATSGTQQITTNTRTIPFPLNFDGVGGTFQLQDALTMSTGRSVTLTNGTLNLNGQTLTNAGSFITATGTKNLTFNAGTLVCPAATTTAFYNAVPTNFTTTKGTGTGKISMTAATAKSFQGGGSTFNCTLNQGGAGALTITGSNTFSNITNTVQPASVLFTAGTTTTFSNFSLLGTAGNLITIGSDTAASHTLSKASGTVSGDYLSISQSIATGGANWYAGANSTDGGNNSGWVFTVPPAPSNNSNFLMFF